MVKNKPNILLFLIIKSFVLINAQNFPLKLSRPQFEQCQSRVKVKDYRPENCDFDGNSYFYPVYIEEFDFKEDLPNNWRFSLDWRKDDNFEADQNGQSKGNLWLGDAYDPLTRGNIYTQNGICYLQTVNQATYAQANGNVSSKFYNFTGALLNSLFSLRQGVFEVKVKLPENPNFWPAYWLFEGNNEIDVYEFYEAGNGFQNNCDLYHQFKMTMHHHAYPYNIQDTFHCKRGRKFKVTEAPDQSDFFSSWHTIKCLWTDYKIHIYLDNNPIPVGYATRYFDGPWLGSGACNKHGEDRIPKHTRDCNYMSTADECNVYGGWPLNECIKWNNVDKDDAWPLTTNPLKLYLNNVINFNLDNVNSTLLTSWNEFDDKDKRMEVDWIKIYQPFNCSAFRNICDMNSLMNITGNTNFLSGGIIKIASGFQNCAFVNDTTNAPDFKNKPLHFLATDEIEIGADASFYQGTYLRAEIVECNGGFSQSQKGNSLFLSDEEIAELEKTEHDSLMKNDSEYRNTINASILNQNILSVEPLKSQFDNGAITLYPNPTSEKLFIDMDEEDFNDIIQVEISDNLGRKIKMEKNNALNVSDLAPGFYELKFLFSQGFLVVKSFIKK